MRPAASSSPLAMSKVNAWPLLALFVSIVCIMLDSLGSDLIALIRLAMVIDFYTTIQSGIKTSRKEDKCVAYSSLCHLFVMSDVLASFEFFCIATPRCQYILGRQNDCLPLPAILFLCWPFVWLGFLSCIIKTTAYY
uniref:Uncharacterized protein n=1 Tax=Arundo donax TaxID=35708 RepID=A0A0A9F180_ARUDO